MPLAGGSAQASASPSPAALTVGSVALDPDRREVTVGGSPIVLTAREFDVLALLMAHAGTVLTRERIAHEALGYDYVGDTNNVDVHIAHLRAKIEDGGSARIIQTVRGVGYVCRTCRHELSARSSDDGCRTWLCGRDSQLARCGFRP